MDYKGTDFPQYRKLVNGKRFYKINGLNEFEEISLIGDKKFHFLSKAEQYPEKLRILDMLSLDQLAHYTHSTAEEWDQLMTEIV